MPLLSLVATQASDFKVVPLVAIFAVAHLHAVVGRTAQPGN
jgi:hypothetical protein